MEPLAALGLVGNIITLVDFSSKLINAASSARHSASGLPEDLQDAAVITKNLESFLTQLPAPTLPPTASAADKALAELTANCRSTCDQLNELVKKIKGKGSGSRRDSLRVAAKGLWHKDKLQELEKRLDSHRSQIMDHFHRIFQEEQSVKLRTLADSQAGMAGKVAEEMEKQLKQTKEQISRMMESVHASSASVTNKLLRDICDRLSDLSTRTKTMNAEQEVLNLLWFPDLRTRKNAVDEAHEGTYQWLLYDPKTDTQQIKSSHHTSNIIAKRNRSDDRETKDKDAWRDRFITWLQAQEGQGSFFISGKPGSGKSTLMKFISRDTRTRQLLQAWAAHDGKQLLFLSFYFWISGTELQKSIEGLYRSMLWEILRQAPELIETTFPTLFRKASAGLLHESDLDPSHLPNMFQQILHSADLLCKYRVCFFIDGLDEYDGDHWTLAKNLKSWCSTPAIKLCVSSRPHPEFTAIFGRPGPWLELHELTRGDIRRVVQDQFAADERVTERQQHSSEFDKLANSLVDKAEGVFIWVVLTMRSLLSGIGNHSSMSQLQKRLDAIPTELTTMFRYIFDGIDEQDLEAAARLFLIIDCPLSIRLEMVPADLDASEGVVNIPLCSSVYIHTLLDDIYENPAYEKSLMQGTLGPPLCHDDWDKKCVAMSHRITGRCRGLVVVRPPLHKRLPATYSIVQLVHRTVRDFLQQPGIMKILQDAAGDFDPLRALSLSLLAALKHTPEIIGGEKPKGPVLPDEAVYVLPQLWSIRETSGSGSVLPELASLTSMFIDLDTQLTWNWLSISALPIPGWSRFIEPVTPGMMETAVLANGILAGTFSTAFERLKGSRLEGSWFLVAASMQHYWTYSGPRHADFTNIIVFLLRYETSINGELPVFCNLAQFSTNEVANRRRAPYLSPVPWTLWTLLLREAAEDMFESRWGGFKAPPNLERSLEMLLKQGADPDVCFIGYDVSKKRVQAHRNTGGKISGLSHLRNVLRGPLSMDLSSLFSIWGFSIGCGNDAGNTEGSSVVVHEPKALSICTQGEETLIKSSLVGNRDSDVSFIVVNVIARDQMARLQTPGIERSLNGMLGGKLGDLLQYFPQ